MWWCLTARLLQKAISTAKNVEAGKIRAWSHLLYLCMWMGAASSHHWQLYNSNKLMLWRYAVCYLWHLLYDARPTHRQVVMILNSKRWLRVTDALQQSFSVSWKYSSSAALICIQYVPGWFNLWLYTIKVYKLINFCNLFSLILYNGR